jgi:cytochrome P450
LGPLALLKTLRNNPLECWTKAHFEEPIVLGGFPFARVAVVSDPGAIREILVDNAAGYRKSALERRILSSRLRDGLVAADGDAWLRQRRTLAPFFARKMLRQLVPEMARTAERLVERWRGLAADEAIEVKSEMSRVALEVLVRCMFSDALAKRQDEFCAAMTLFFKSCAGFDPFDILGLPDFVPRLTQRRKRSMLEPFDRAFDALVSERRARNRDPEEARDILDAMIVAKDPDTGRAMSEAEIRANVLTFVFAGQETTSTALTWAIYLLSQSQQWHERVAAESRRVLAGAGPLDNAVESLIETRAVIDEAMRLYPPIIGITRCALRPATLAGTAIAPGTMIIVSPYILHRHRRLWNEPDVFDPSRFLDKVQRPIERFSYLPFGAGPRACIGAAFALLEATLVLATIMQHFTLTPVPGQTVWPVQGFTLGIRGGLRMTVRPHEPRLNGA